MYFLAAAGDESERARLEALQRRQRPENEAPVSVAVDAVLLEGPDTAVLLGNVQAFSTGVAFSVTAMTRRPVQPDAGGLGAALHHHGGAAAPLLFGVEYADGRSASTVAGPDDLFGGAGSADTLTLWPTGGGGGSRFAEIAFYLSPLPPPGVVRFIAAWPSLGLPEATTEISADEILAAADRVRRLWDWEPDPPSRWWRRRSRPGAGSTPTSAARRSEG